MRCQPNGALQFDRHVSHEKTAMGIFKKTFVSWAMNDSEPKFIWIPIFWTKALACPEN